MVVERKNADKKEGTQIRKKEGRKGGRNYGRKTGCQKEGTHTRWKEGRKIERKAGMIVERQLGRK